MLMFYECDPHQLFHHGRQTSPSERESERTSEMKKERKDRKYGFCYKDEEFVWKEKKRVVGRDWRDREMSLGDWIC